MEKTDTFNQVPFVISSLLMVLSVFLISCFYFQKPDLMLPVLCTTAAGLDITLVIAVLKNNYDNIFRNIWLSSTLIMFAYRIYQIKITDGFRAETVIQILLMAPVSVFITSVIFSGNVSLIMPMTIGRRVFILLIGLITLGTSIYLCLRYRPDFPGLPDLDGLNPLPMLTKDDANKNKGFYYIETEDIEPMPNVSEIDRIGEQLTAGFYVQENDFSIKPLPWYVVSSDDAHAVLITKDVIAREPYDYSGCVLPFQHSFIYEWLNTYFENDALASVNSGCTYTVSLLTAEEATSLSSGLSLIAEATSYALSLENLYDSNGKKVS